MKILSGPRGVPGLGGRRGGEIVEEKSGGIGGVNGGI